MARNWANKYQDRWFVRIDGHGNPVYGSLIPRPYKPRNGRWVEVIIPDQICCAIPSFTLEILPDDFVLGGQLSISIGNLAGVFVTVIINNAATHAATLTALVQFLNTEHSAFGTWTVSGNVISLQTELKDIILTDGYTGAITDTLDPVGFAAATNVDVSVAGFFPVLSTPKGASLAATLTTIVGLLNTSYANYGTWVAITNGIRLDDRQVPGVAITLAYS